MTYVLVVDDSAVDRTLAGKLLEAGAQCQVGYASNGREALEQMARRLPEVVVTDMHMPEMDGLALVTAIRRDFPTTPIVLITAQGSESLAIEALRHGAANYLSKQRLAQDLVETVAGVLSAARVHRHHQRLQENLATTEWSFVLENDTALIPALVECRGADMANLIAGDETTQMRLGIALHEALVNAIDHGNLELCSDMREQDDCSYHDLAHARRQKPPYNQRRVYFSFLGNRDEVRFTIRDEGPGFDPATLPDPTDPANLERVCGRGLLLIRTFMDEVHHNSTGNEITMVKRRA